ncbi:MAG TPA: pyridoxal-phosphate dependent enzyme [Candidatus Kryptonia bacterium]|nr:pyridoxal-phosphate dependent enzyme [Candidatus Kryptonia bacterium]
MSARPSSAAVAVTPPRDRPRRALSALDLIGNTPLVQIARLPRGFRTKHGQAISPRVRIYAKLEGLNPGGSVKDRPALWMIREGIASGRLTPGKTILDSTSGNTGIALAMIGAVLGYPVELVMPSNVSQERKKIITAYGAQITYSSPLEGSDGAIRLCRQVLAADPQRYFKPDQYFNENNPRAHYESTGPEIWHDTNGTVTHFVAGIGTGGTIMGTGRYLKECNPRIQIIAAEPDDALHGLEGLKHMASSIVPGIYREHELDRKIPVGTEAAYDTVYQLGADEGIVVGQSSGAALWAALQVAAELDEGVIVLIFSDFGDKYLSTNLWAGWRDWLRANRRAT